MFTDEWLLEPPIDNFKDDIESIPSSDFVYIAPENLDDIFENSDMWALGVILFKMSQGYYPFTNSKKSRKDFCEEIRVKDIPSISNVSEEVENIIRGLLNKNNFKRPSIKKLLQTATISKILNDLVKEYEECKEISEFFKTCINESQKKDECIIQLRNINSKFLKDPKLYDFDTLLKSKKSVF